MNWTWVQSAILQLLPPWPSNQPGRTIVQFGWIFLFLATYMVLLASKHSHHRCSSEWPSSNLGIVLLVVGHWADTCENRPFLLVFVGLSGGPCDAQLQWEILRQWSVDMHQSPRHLQRSHGLLLSPPPTSFSSGECHWALLVWKEVLLGYRDQSRSRWDLRLGDPYCFCEQNFL